MNLRRMWVIARKDLRETLSTPQFVVPVTVVPFVIVVCYPALFLLALRFTPGAVDGMQGFLSSFPASAVPDIPGLTAAGRAGYVSVVYLFAGFFLLVPVMIATVIAANSFAGEKERRTLEGLLYTPVTDAELVVGKIAAAFVPAIVFAWMCFALYTVIVNWLGGPLIGGIFFPTGNWWVLMFALVPAVAFFIIAAVVLVSAKARGFQEANAIGGVLSLPIIGIVAAQAAGLMVLSAEVVFGVAAFVTLCDIGLVWVFVRTFRRARIVTYLQ